MKKCLLKKISAIALAVVMAVSLVPVMDFMSGGSIGSEIAYAAEENGVAVTLSPKTEISPGKTATFDLVIKNTTNKTVIANVYTWYYRENGNDEKYPGVHFGSVSGTGYVKESEEDGHISVEPNKQLNLTLTGTIPPTWNGKSVISVVVSSNSLGYYGQADYPERADEDVQFSDVTDKDAFYYAPVYWAATTGITTGWPDGTFRPWTACNRAAVVTFLWRMAGRPKVSTKATFKDMTGNEEFDMAISWAVEKGITTGWSDNTFRPWRTCNRAAIMTFLWRYAEKPEASKSKFTDKTGNKEFDKAIAWASENNIANGWGDGTFRPWNDCNRAAVVSFLYRY